jgi:hypothetical protein
MAEFEPPVDNEWTRHMRSLLGKQVKVTLQTQEEGGHPVVVTGQLTRFSDSGEVALRDECGFTTWAWPNLETEEVGDA